MAGLSDEQYIVDAEGKRRGIILPIERYEQLKEDLHDLAIVAERKNEECISLDEMKRRLKRDGILLNCIQTISRKGHPPSSKRSSLSHN
jgi:hypothetical protein